MCVTFEDSESLAKNPFTAMDYDRDEASLRLFCKGLF